MNTTIILKLPAECSESEFKLFQHLVRYGGEVQNRGLLERITRAKVLAFLMESGETIGIAALKQPDANYKSGVFARAKATEISDEFLYEVGWVVITDRYQGKKLSIELVNAVMSRSEGEKVFATSATTRKAMHKTLIRYGFVQHGQAYRSSRRDQKLLLFVTSNGLK